MLFKATRLFQGIGQGLGIRRYPATGRRTRPPLTEGKADRRERMKGISEDLTHKSGPHLPLMVAIRGGVSRQPNNADRPSPRRSGNRSPDSTRTAWDPKKSVLNVRRHRRAAHSGPPACPASIFDGSHFDLLLESQLSRRISTSFVEQSRTDLPLLRRVCLPVHQAVEYSHSPLGWLVGRQILGMLTTGQGKRSELAPARFSPRTSALPKEPQHGLRLIALQPFRLGHEDCPRASPGRTSITVVVSFCRASLKRRSKTSSLSARR